MSQLVSKAYFMTDAELAKYSLPEFKSLEADVYPSVGSPPIVQPNHWLEAAETNKIDELFLKIDKANTYTLIANYYLQTAILHSIGQIDLSEHPELRRTFIYKSSRLLAYLISVYEVICSRLPDDWFGREILESRLDWAKKVAASCE